MILAFFSTEFKSIKWPFDWQQQTSRGRNLSQGLYDLLLISQKENKNNNFKNYEQYYFWDARILQFHITWISTTVSFSYIAWLEHMLWIFNYHPAITGLQGAFIIALVEAMAKDLHVFD